MPKKPSKTPPPEPAQIKAVERLLRDRDYPRAIERARVLVQRFPDHGGANQLLVDALDLGRDRGAAALAAYQWLERRPNSPRALETFFPLAVEGRHLALAYRVAERARVLGALSRVDLTDAAGLQEILRQPDGSQITREQAEQFDIGRLHLNADDFAGVVRVLDGCSVLSARNNRAFALFHLNRVEEALTAFLEAWAQDPENLYALGWALRLRLYLGDETGARALGVPLTQAHARRSEDAYGQLTALLLIHEDQAAWDAFERMERAAWAASERRHRVAERLHLAAGAASRLGRADTARTLWREALEQDPRHAAAAENLAVLERDAAPLTCPALFGWRQVLPIDWMRRLSKADEAHLESVLGALTVSDAYLETIYLAGDATVRDLGAQLLTDRLTRESPVQRIPGGPPERRAAAILRDLACRPVGTPEERGEFLRSLRESGVVDGDETVQFWDGKVLRSVQAISTQIDRALRPTDLPADLEALLIEAADFTRMGEFAASEARLNAILERVPDHPIALGNLAVLRARQGRDTECRELYRRVVAAHPEYLFARCNLAVLLVEDGDLAEAKELLDGLFERPRLHLQEVFALYGALAMLSRAQGEDASADALIARLEQLVETDDDRRRLALAKARVALASPGRRIT